MDPIFDHDPRSDYGPTRVEHQAQRVRAVIPDAEVTRTSEVIQFWSGGEAGIVVLVTAETVEVRLARVEWTLGSHGPRLVSRAWRRARCDRLDDPDLRELLAAGHEARAREYRACQLCGERFPVERRHGDVCHGCAETRLGVVH